MALLNKLSKFYVADEVTAGQGKASDADYDSTEVSADLVAGTPIVNASIVSDTSNLYRFLGGSNETGVDLTSEDFTNVNRWADLGEAWTETDAIVIQDDSTMSYAIASIESNDINGSYVACPSQSGAESSTGSVNSSMSVKAVTGSEMGQLSSHILFKQGLGKYVEAGANISGNTVVEVASGGTHDLYKFAGISDTIPSIAVRAVQGGSADNVIDFGGIVVNSITTTLTAGQKATLAYDLGGSNFFPRSGDTVNATPLGCQPNPFIVKKAYFVKEGGDILEASDVTLTVTNTVADSNFIKDSGISERTTTGKSVTISFNENKVNQSNLLAFKGNSAIGLYLSLKNSVGSEFNAYLPNLRYQSISDGNNSGILTEESTLMGANDANGNAIYIATKA